MYITRDIETSLQERLFQGKIIIIYGARQVGKTTLVKNILQNHPSARYFHCENMQIRDILASQDLARILAMIGDTKLVVFDEAQVVEHIGTSIKILFDHHPEIQIIATGSSSFDLATKVVEPMTGRHVDFMMFPFSYAELARFYGDDILSLFSLEDRILFGNYPEVLFPRAPDTDRDVLTRIAHDYTLKDILSFSGIRKSDTIMKLLKALAYQMGQEVSYAELSKNFGMSIQTVENYIDILEKAFIIFRLQPYIGNKRTGLRRTRKVYFWDTGLRNALINNFEPLELRPDKWALFENYVISELHKKNLARNEYNNFYFWRAYNGEEIDLLIERDGKVSGYECKWRNDKKLLTRSDNAPTQTVTLVTTENFSQFLV